MSLFYRYSDKRAEEIKDNYLPLSGGKISGTLDLSYNRIIYNKKNRSNK